MVCKKSLYCLKNGPCATYQIRKQIWEDNIRFRESLRNINQSDHYWSFQVTNNDFSDLDEPSFYKRRNKTCLKVKSRSDCASVTHEYSPEDICRSCACSKKNGNLRRYSITNEVCPKEDSPETKALLPRPSKKIQTQPSIPGSSYSRLYSSNNHSKGNKNVSEYCHRYRNSLSSAQLLPSSKVKFSSQSTLVQPKRNAELRKFPSMEVLSKHKSYSTTALQNSSNNSKQEIEIDGSNQNVEKSKSTKNLSELDKLKSDILKNREIKLPPWLSGPPISRTTRKMLRKERQIPFATFGCNNSNDLVGMKKTHNVYASTKDIYPNALLAKQQREDMITKSLQTEKQFRNSLLQDNTSKKLINHSSLWATESTKDMCKSHKRNNSSQLQKKLKKID